MSASDRPLYTPRLRLEPVTARVAELAVTNVDGLARHLDADLPDDWRRAGLPLLRRNTSAANFRPSRCVAIHREGRCAVGDIRYEQIGDPEEGAYEIGYAIIPAYRRQGLAIEATGAIIDWLFDEAAAQLIIGGCDRRNLASIRTLRKLGFWLDGSKGSAFWWRLTPDLRKGADA